MHTSPAARQDPLEWFRLMLGIALLAVSWGVALAALLVPLLWLFLIATVAALLRRRGWSSPAALRCAAILGVVFPLLLLPSPAVRSWWNSRWAIETMTVEAHRDGPAAFVRGLQSADLSVRFESAVGLGATATVAEREACERGLLDPDPRVRMWCARALGRIQRRSSVPALLARLDDPEPLVRCYAIYGLSEIRELATLPRLRELLRHNEHIYVSKYLADAIPVIEGSDK